MSVFDEILARTPKAKSDGEWTVGLCSGHEANGNGHKPSLRFRRADVDDGALVCCMAGCAADKLHTAFGFDEGVRVKPTNDPKTFLFFRASTDSGGKRSLVATYDYVDETGRLLFQVCRYDPKDFRQRRADGNGGWTWKLDAKRRVLYRLPQVLEAVAAGSCIYIVEGEKDVETLERLGLVATCNPGGAGKWRDEYAEQIGGADRAIILPDNDEPGRNHARAVSESLGSHGVPHVTIRLPGVAEKGDVSDWVATGHTAADLQALMVQAEADRGEAETEETQTVTPPGEQPEVAYRLTELGNAERFAAQHAVHVRVPRGRGLLAYDARRGIYAVNYAVLVRYAKTTVRSIYGEAAENLDEKKRKAIAAHAQHSESKKAIDAMLALAAAEEALEGEAKDFDADPELLNCTNGVVDLRSAACLPHSPAYRMTKVAGAAYDPEAEAPVWHAHLERIFEGDTEIIAFLQRLYGYVLTGYSREQVFVVFYGEGANGKSDTVFGMTKALGSGGSSSYHKATAITTFTPHRNDHIRNSLAALAGARFVTTSENRINQTLDEGLIKEITGGEEITARFLHREDFSFCPQFLLLISTNHKPRVDAPDFAFKRRVLLVPFNVTLPETEWDRQHAEKLAAELDGILTWGVEGAVDYLAHGLCIPEKVRAATEAYREEMDPLRAFKEECVILDPDAFTPTIEIRGALEKWAKEEGVKVQLSPNELAAWLGRFGRTAAKQRHVRGWRGLRIAGADSQQAFDGDAEVL
jgi:putative DNA primase/helicase